MQKSPHPHSPHPIPPSFKTMSLSHITLQVPANLYQAFTVTPLPLFIKTVSECESKAETYHLSKQDSLHNYLGLCVYENHNLYKASHTHYTGTVHTITYCAYCL